MEEINNLKEMLEKRLEEINKQIEIYKNNTIEEIKKEAIIPATNYLLQLRDLKEQQLLLKTLINNIENYKESEKNENSWWDV